MERRQTSTLKPQASGKVQNSDPKSSPSNEMAKGRGQSDRKSLLSPSLSSRGREGESSGTWVPLLLKLTVTITPYGTIIMVPKYWSFDPRRDLKWKEIARLHRTRSARKLGPKLISNQAERREEAKRARELWEQATEAGLRGEKREQWVMGRLGWDAR